MSEPIIITGLDGAKDDLVQIPARIVQQFFHKALAAGGGVLQDELERRTPVADSQTTSTKEYGRLVDDISTQVGVAGLHGSAKTGFRKKGYVAVMVEYGHAKTDGGRVQANPFMRAAFEAAKDAAVDEFIDQLTENF